MGKIKIALLTVSMLVAAFVAGLFGSTQEITKAAPELAVTPALTTSVSGNEAPLTLNYYDGATSYTADTRVCRRVAQFSHADIEVTLQKTTSTTSSITVTVESTIGGVVYERSAGNLLAVSSSTSTAAVSDLKQYQLFGTQTCVRVQPSNTEPFLATVNAVFK